MEVSHAPLHLDLRDRKRLARSYLSFVKGGGLFVPTETRYELGDEAVLFVLLPGAAEERRIAGKVVWISPRGAASAHQQGIGVQLPSQEHGELHHQIEVLLAGVAASPHPVSSFPKPERGA
ncbi:MAG TPA: PilZ domain-containing protein [Gammaproteobacteria bacterium]|nr:PilZ domain-containing protein [Gammaproteobacteria bacterium]